MATTKDRILNLQPRNDKSMRLRYLRDRLHITGEHAPSLKLSVEILIEMMGITYSPRYLSYVRRETVKLRQRCSDPTPEELQLLAFLDDRIRRRTEQIHDRLAKQKGKRGGRPKTPKSLTPPPGPAPGEDVWDL
jgi:hypothetical protein